MSDQVAVMADHDRLARARDLAEPVITCVGEILLGKDHEIRLAMTCLLARGHLLVEDLPGVGKTLFARALAGALGLEFRRIQFTSDLLPADVIGVSVFEQSTSEFRFHPGPLFAHVVLADEVNRATPKAQSALLEAMEEHQVTAEGVTYDLPAPYFVIATQNPQHQIGTFPLPESQLDRFLMRLGLGYPGEALERELLRGGDRRGMIKTLEPVLTAEQLIELQAAASTVHVAEPLLDYAQALIAYTRQSPDFEYGLSPRAAVDLLAAARAWSMLSGHRGVRPEDLKAVFPAVAAHRLTTRDPNGRRPEEMAQQLLERVPLP
ncbi:MAG: AAA family ATPase [Gammaproteobacteria bacterium]